MMVYQVGYPFQCKSQEIPFKYQQDYGGMLPICLRETRAANFHQNKSVLYGFSHEKLVFLTYLQLKLKLNI